MATAPLRDTSSLGKVDSHVYALLKQYADDGEYLPTNREIANRLGYKSVSTPSESMTHLYELGFIKIECRVKSRRITIYETGQVIFSKYWYRCPPPERLEKWVAPNPDSIAFRLDAEAVKRSTERRAYVDSLRVMDRTPCRRCQVRHDFHEEHGCNAYIAAVAA